MGKPLSVLIVSPAYPHPPNDGHKVRIYNLFRHITSGCKFDLIAFGEDDLTLQSEMLKNQLGPCYNSVEFIPHSSLIQIEKIRGIARIKNILYPYEKSIGEPFYSEALANRIREKVDSVGYDLIYLCGLYIALHFGKNSRRVPYVVDIGDSMSLLARSYYKKEHRPLKKFKNYFNYIWSDRYEKIYCSRMKNIIMISPADAEIIRENCPRSRVWVVPNGVDTDYFTPVNSCKQTTNSLLFTGVMEYPPNNDAMLHFLKKIYPIVKERVPDVTLTIAGRNPTRELRDLVHNTQGVQLTGYIEDLRQCFESAAIYVSPLISGAGMKNKILEAWSMSKPVVATRMSCDGINARDNENIIIADSPSDIAEKIVLLLQNESLRTSLSKNGRSTVELAYSWTVSSKTLMEIFDEILRKDREKRSADTF